MIKLKFYKPSDYEWGGYSWHRIGIFYVAFIDEELIELEKNLRGIK